MSFQKVESFWSEYNLHGHICALLPAGVMLCTVALVIGTGNEVTSFFANYRAQHPGLTFFFSTLTNWTNPFFYFLYAAIFYKGFKEQKLRLMLLGLSFLFVQLAISFLFVRIVKMSIGKPRPMSAFLGENYTPFTVQPGFHSFPSGHTTEISASILPLAARSRYTWQALLWGGLIALVGFSRIYLSMHHTADIFAGLLIGSFASICIQYFCTWKKDR